MYKELTKLLFQSGGGLNSEMHINTSHLQIYSDILHSLTIIFVKRNLSTCYHNYITLEYQKENEIYPPPHPQETFLHSEPSTNTWFLQFSSPDNRLIAGWGGWTKDKLKKTRSRPQMESLVLSPSSPNQDKALKTQTEIS